MKIQLNNPLNMNKGNTKLQNSKSKLCLTKNLSNSYFKDIHDVNTMKQSDSQNNIRRVLSSQNRMKEKIILKYVEKKKSFLDFFFN